MKKIISLILAAVMLTALLTACTHKTSAPSTEGELTVAVRDESAMPVVGAVIEVCEGSRIITTVTTGSNGRASANLLFGEYTLKIKSLPDGFEVIKASTVYNHSVGSSNAVITVKNVNGIGTQKNPYIISGDTTISLGVGEGAYYLIRPNGDKNTLYIPNAEGLSIKIDGIAVHTNNRGNISYTASGETLVMITNGGSKINAAAQLIAPFGSSGNPIKATLGTTYTADVTGRTIYYTFTAENTDNYLFMGISGKGEYTLTTASGEVHTASTTDSIEIPLTSGDTVTFTVSGTGSVSYGIFSVSSELPFQPF